MEQTPIATGHIEDDIIDKITAGGNVRELLEEYKTRVTDESWEGWTFAQGLAYNTERDVIEDQRRVLEEMRKSIHRLVAKYNTHVIKHHAEFPDEEKFETHPACPGEGCEECPKPAEEAPTEEAAE